MPSIEQKAWEPTQWSVVDSKTNAVATATKAGVSNRQHYVTGLSVSFSAAPVGAVVVQLLDGATVIDQYQIPAANTAPIITNFVPPIAMTVGNSTSVTITAAGAGVVATASVRGKTY